jgi:hypothetical protein
MATRPSQRFGVARDVIAPAGAGRDARSPQNSVETPRGEQAVERTLSQPLESNFSTGATTRIMLYVNHV